MRASTDGGSPGPRRRPVGGRRARPDLECAVLRGNVQTRLAKLAAGDCDATLLALAGLKRLGREDVATEILGLDRFPPALSQGAVAVEMRRDDDRMIDALARLNHAETETAVSTERGFLAALDGSCRTPIAGLATVEGDSVVFSGLIASPDGKRVEETSTRGDAALAAEIGFEAGRALRARVGDGFFASWG